MPKLIAHIHLVYYLRLSCTFGRCLFFPGEIYFQTGKIKTGFQVQV